MEKIMNDQQFEALLATLGRMTDALEEIDARLAMMTAAYVRLSDPDGWQRASDAADAADAEEAAEFDTQGLS